MEIDAPPVEDGGVKAALRTPSLPETVLPTIDGADGTVRGVLADFADVTPYPATFSARTRMSYCVPLVNEVVPSDTSAVMSMGDPVVPPSVLLRHVTPSSVEYWYMEIKEPPFGPSSM
jgi:hypothetical protein